MNSSCVIPALAVLCANDCRAAHRCVVLLNTALVSCYVLQAWRKTRRVMWNFLLCRKSFLQD